MTRDEPSQARVIAFLSDPATHSGATVERISTHGAHIFLAGNRAYKLKRAVKLAFLDFSTVEKRHAVLETELRINAPAAPGLYLEVAPIGAGVDGRLGFGESGPALDWVLVMCRFRQDALLDDVAARGALTVETIDALARSIVAMHRRAAVVRKPMSASFTAMALANLASLADIPEFRERIVRLEAELRRECAALADHLDSRARGGFVRRCHGDLHLRNIVLLDGNPVPFDALEFDPELATGDVYYDVAFLLMDLEHRGLTALANRLLNRYAALTDDLEGLRGLSLFLAVRAAVRAKVAALTAAGAAENERRLSLKEAESYLDLAAGYLPAPAPRLIAIGGLSGTGKSTVAADLAPEIKPAPGAMLLRSDVVRKRLHGVEDTARLPPSAYGRDITAKVYDTLMAAARRALSAGQSVVVDAVFARPEERQLVEGLAEQCGRGFVGVWLDAPLAIRLDRVGHRSNDASDADAAVAERQESYALGNLPWRRVDAGGTPQMAQNHVRAVVCDSAPAI